jgi:ankyrin repeat protein
MCSVALSKWPKHSNANKFKGLRWAILRRIELMGFKIEEIVDPKNLRRVYPNTGLNFFGGVCELGHRDIALLMVKSGSVDINGKDEYDQTPLFHASYKGMIEVVRALVEAGADLNQAEESGATPLHAASQQGHVDVVRCLAEAGADRNQAREDKDTPLYAASHMDHLDMVKYLVEAGVDLNPGNYEGGTSLALARHRGHKKVVAYLEGVGATA